MDTAFRLPDYVESNNGVILNSHVHIDTEGQCLYDKYGRLIRTERGKCLLVELVYDPKTKSWLQYSQQP